MAKKIVSQEIISSIFESAPVDAPPVVSPKVQSLTPTTRPPVLQSFTYKLNTPLSESALYVTLSHIERGGKQVPFEIFLNSKDMRHYQWMVALTRILSAIFRTAPDVAFVAEELKSVLAPEGGYWKKGTYVPSLVAEIGGIIEEDLRSLGLIETTTKQTTAKKLNTRLQCPKCHQYSLVISEGCEACCECDYSRCG